MLHVQKKRLKARKASTKNFTTEQGSRASFSLLLVKGCNSSVGPSMLKSNKISYLPRLLATVSLKLPKLDLGGRREDIAIP